MIPRKNRTLLFLLALLVVWSAEVPCQPQPGTIEVIQLNTGTKFRFKGLAMDIGNQKAYLGSWDQKEIVVVDLLSNTHSIIKTKYSGRLNVMGVYLHGSILYAVMNEINDDPSANPISALAMIDTQTRSLWRSYEVRGERGRHHFNHVVVDANGIAYISNTLKSAIFSVDTKNPQAKIRSLAEHPDLSWVHGIDLSPDGSRLFCTSYHGGIKFLDLKQNTFSPFRDSLTAENDGLKYHGGFLYGIGKNALKRYTLNADENAVVATEILIPDHPFFNDPRCLDIKDGWLYCLANAAFDIVHVDRPAVTSGFKKEPFRDTYILRYRL